MHPERAPDVEFRAVTKRFANGTLALDALTLTVPAGKIVALLGTSGSGKTTALKMINRMEEPSAGEVLIGHVPVAQSDPIRLRRGIGYVIQEGGLFPHWTVRENVELVPRLLNWTEEQTAGRYAAAMRQARLAPDEFGARYPATLSGGQRQRVAIARALAAEPRLLLLDEPFGALDPITRDGLHDELLALVRELGNTTILVTHDVTEAFKLADCVALLDQGRLIQCGAPADLVLSPANGFVKQFFRQHGFDLRLRYLKLDGVARFLAVDREAPAHAPLELSGRQTLADALDLIATQGVENFVVRCDGAPARGPFRRRDVWALLREQKQ